MDNFKFHTQTDVHFFEWPQLFKSKFNNSDMNQNEKSR